MFDRAIIGVKYKFQVMNLNSAKIGEHELVSFSKFSFIISNGNFKSQQKLLILLIWSNFF